MTTQPNAKDRRQREAVEMTMVERVARQIEPLAWAVLGAADTQAYARKRESSLRKARDVLEAMREPTERMGVDAHAVYAAGSSAEARCTWRIMIDAALAEHDALDG